MGVDSYVSGYSRLDIRTDILGAEHGLVVPSLLFELHGVGAGGGGHAPEA